jgi:hypothetical protein
MKKIVEVIRGEPGPDLDQRGYECWLRSRPKPVQDLLRDFPPRTAIVFEDGSNVEVMGATEDDKLIVFDPRHEYEEGNTESKSYICAKHLREFVQP